MIQDKILEIEQSIIGKSSLVPSLNISFSYIGMGISLILSLYNFSNILSDEGTSFKALIFAVLVLLASSLAIYLTITSLIKQTFWKNPASTLLGILSAWIIYLVVNGFGHFALIEADWEVVWANRVLVLVGQLMTESLTQSYLPNQSWRLWSILYLTFALIAAAYGTTGEKPLKFLIPFTIFCGILTYIAWNPTAINYNSDEPVMKLIGATILSYFTFGASYIYCS